MATKQLRHLLSGLEQISAFGPSVRPIPTRSPLGRTNDAIVYGGQVHLYVTGPADDAHALANELPSECSRDYGQPFAEIF
jgi:methenyltetrahydromethanopterin cyclohydrolase